MTTNKSIILANLNEFLRYQKLLDHVAQSPSPYPADRFSGRGIVICGGGDVYFPCAWVCINMLRRQGCTLPVELWYRGPREMNSQMIALLSNLGVTCRDAYEVARMYPTRRLDSWELKPFAIVNSRFQELLYLDADNIPVQNPETLFDRLEYLECGSIFWPDRLEFPLLNREAWKLCRVPFVAKPEIESGQLVIDKKRCWQALQLTMCLNEHSEFYYQYFYGDKDTFNLAWRRAGIRYALAPSPAISLDKMDCLIQFDFDRRVLFQHRSNDKFSTTRANRRLAGFQNEDQCFALLQDLKELWSGHVRKYPEEFDATEREAYLEICSIRWFELGGDAGPRATIEFLPDLSIGQGADYLKCQWMVEADKDNRALLSIRHPKGPTCFLRKTEAHSWTGRFLLEDRARLQLRAVCT